MPATLDDCFVVFVREQQLSKYGPEWVERELVSCRTHEEAEWVRREFGFMNRRCVIRYVGPVGGGD